MITTFEHVQIVDKAEELAKMVWQSELAENYHRCLNKVQQDKEAQDLISAFHNMKDRFDEVQRFGKYHPDYRKVTLETRELKRKVDLQESIHAFKQAEDEIQKTLDEISVMIGKAVSENVKVPTGNPFFDSLSSCGGGCGSGGGCGCKAS
ncbi:YlbF family regulator [Sutcliffiella deserti]|uniref:YlbF family regulator n=1 Tax=Sutcliffiella deserti TaxID=2875501 RepID=UPI001CC0C565|nr:YlbF family regulator [Sutcliffiella deserti]